MIRKRYIDQVYLNVTGGLPTDDIAVERLDIDNHFNAVLPAAIEDSFTQRMILSERKGRPYVIDEEFVTQVEIPLSEDKAKCLFYGVLPKRYQGLPNNGGVRNVTSLDMSTQLVKLRSLTQLQGTDLPGCYCWFINDGQEKVYVRGLPPEVKTILAEIVVLADDIGPDDEVRVPGIVKDEVIARMTEYFSRQRMMPEDETDSGSDEINNQ